MSFYNCSNCNEEKDITNFYLKSDGSIKTYNCKDCRKKYFREYRLNNIENIKERHRNYYLENADEYKKKKRNCYNNNEEERNKQKERTLKHYYNNKLKYSLYRKEYYQNNKEKLNKRSVEYRKNRMKNDNDFRIINNVRLRINQYFKKNEIPKRKRFNKLIECDNITFNEWINFNIIIDNLDINNIHIDHIYPLSKYNNNHWSNLFPVYSTFNRTKSNKEPTKEYILKTQKRYRQFLQTKLFD